MIKEEREERKSKRKRVNELKKKLTFSSVPFQRWNDTVHVC